MQLQSEVTNIVFLLCSRRIISATSGISSWYRSSRRRSGKRIGGDGGSNSYS